MRKLAMTLSKKTTFHHRFSARSHKLLQVQVRQNRVTLQKSNISYQLSLEAMTRKRARAMTMKERCGRWVTSANLSPYRTVRRLQLTRCTLITWSMSIVSRIIPSCTKATKKWSETSLRPLTNTIVTQKGEKVLGRRAWSRLARAFIRITVQV